MIAISKSDLLDEELTGAIRQEFPPGAPGVFFSSVTGEGIPALKDRLWTLLDA